MEEQFFTELTEQALSDDIERIVVGAVIMSKDKVLVLKRRKTDFLEGIYELPSGKLEEGETIPIALEREVREETNLKLKDIFEYIGTFDYKSKTGKLTRQFNFIITVIDPSKVKLSEHERYAWINKETINEYKISDETKKTIRKALN